MRDLARLVAGTLRRDALASADDRIAIAVSGGPDSVALAWLLHDLAPAMGFRIAGLLHLHHGLRGADADADEAFVRALAGRLGVPCEVGRADVAALARRTRRSMEAAAREARYAFFEDAARRLAATRVATGHTADDQAETVLLRLLRGAGGRGVTGIRVKRGPFIRPLLECRRAELRAYLSARGEAFREDASNADRAIARNRLRHELLPVIEQLAPGGVRALARHARLAADDESLLEDFAAAAIERVDFHVLSGGAGVQLNSGALTALPPALARRVIRRAMEAADPRGQVSHRDVEAIRRLAAADRTDGHLDLAGLGADRCGRLLLLRHLGSGRAVPAAFARELTLPGEVALPEIDATIAARRASKDVMDGDVMKHAMAGRRTEADGQVAIVQAASVTPPFVVRTRRPGDRFRPLGAPGRRKVQDVFVDRKVPRDQRDRVPIVADAAGRIVWVAGVALAHECRVTAPEAGVVIFELRHQKSTA